MMLDDTRRTNNLGDHAITERGLEAWGDSPNRLE